MEKLTPEYPADALAEALAVSESGFAAHRRKALRPRRQHDEQLRPLITLSMSRTGNPYDNALAESFVATLKTECFGTSIPPTRAAAELMAFDYIETFYNRRRRYSSLGQRSPLDFKKQMFPPNKTN